MTINREKFNNFNEVFSYMYNRHRPLYAIACFDLKELLYLTGEVGDDLKELQAIYKEKYTWKAGQIGVTEWHYEIIQIGITLEECKHE